MHTKTHIPNHVDADILFVDGSNDYNQRKQDTYTYSGYDAVDKFCNWLFTSQHLQPTVMAHNQAGYDGRFILQWCLNRGLHPSRYIRQGSRTMYMEFAKYHIRFVDYSHFFLEPMKMPLSRLSANSSMIAIYGVLSVFPAASSQRQAPE